MKRIALGIIPVALLAVTGCGSSSTEPAGSSSDLTTPAPADGSSKAGAAQAQLGPGAKDADTRVGSKMK